jgi:hypothetical protein
MLITFTCAVYADITMFGDVGVHLLKLMGHSGTVPGALKAEDVYAALERLETGVEVDELSTRLVESAKKDNNPPISLRHRALPLIELLRAAEKSKCDVMWNSNK